jgi:hypothetical protein
MRADGIDVSTSTVDRALRRHGLLLPAGYRADRTSWTGAAPAGVPASADRTQPRLADQQQKPSN